MERLIPCLLTSLFLTLDGALAQKDPYSEWENQCIKQILEHYKGPKLAEGDPSVGFTIYPSGTIKWPHCKKPLHSLNSTQKIKVKAVEEALLAAAPLPSWPKDYVLKRGRGSFWVSGSEPLFCVDDYAGAWTTEIYPDDKLEVLAEIINPIKQRLVLPRTKHQIHTAIFLVVDPDGKVGLLEPAHCARIKPGFKPNFPELYKAQKALLKAAKSVGKFDVTAISAAEEELKPTVMLIVYRSYAQPKLGIIRLANERNPDYLDLYENGKRRAKDEPKN